MNLRLPLSLVSLTLLGSLSGCAAMLPIAGALVLKEAADRYEAANRQQDPKAAPAETTVASVPDDAAPQVEEQSETEAQPAVATRVASSKSSKPQLKAPVTQTPVASADPQEPETSSEFQAADEQQLAALETTIEIDAQPVTSNSEEYTDEQIAASQRPLKAEAVRTGPPKPVIRAGSKPVTNTAAKPALAPSKTGNAQSKSDPAAQANKKAQEAVKAASSLPTTEAEANESATDSASRILATALKRIPNPQANPATKPAPITPQKSN
jgi:hypothetical protein